MSKTVVLPVSGATVVLRDAESLKVKDRNRVMRSIGDAEGLAAGLSMADGLLAVLIESWSLDLMIPSVSIDSLGEMEMADYDLLLEEARSAIKVLFPQFGDTMEAQQNPDSPTVAFNG